MRLYDTARRRIVPFEPPETVTMYVCGLTPYDATHLGHAATYVTYDVLQRRLEDRGHRVRLVRNITDVDDDLLREARDRDVHYLDLATAGLRRFDRDMAALGVREPWREPRATGAIPDIRGLVAMLLARGHAYESGGGVYFAVGSVPRFGSLSGLSRREMLRLGPAGGERIDDPAKRDPLDFVLWQPESPGEPAWESPWGRGRPGWHAECSALALRELGPTIDLHGGGQDLVYPHHECEQAQSEAATGERFVRHWMHRGLICSRGEKMSKSRANLVFVADLLERVDPRAIRLALLSEHYRRSVEWSEAYLQAGVRRLERWQRRARRGGTVLAEVQAALDDDLDTPRALAAVDAAVERGEGVGEAAALLGVDLGGWPRGSAPKPSGPGSGRR